jgi:hypothetical protein
VKRVPVKARRVSNSLAIRAYMHCGLCTAELQEIRRLGTLSAIERDRQIGAAADRLGYPVAMLGRIVGAELSPEQYACLAVGWTEFGLQVWCARHDANVIHLDFEGQKHPADATATRRDDRGG